MASVSHTGGMFNLQGKADNLGLPIGHCVAVFIKGLCGGGHRSALGWCLLFRAGIRSENQAGQLVASATEAHRLQNPRLPHRMRSCRPRGRSPGARCSHEDVIARFAGDNLRVLRRAALHARNLARRRDRHHYTPSLEEYERQALDKAGTRCVKSARKQDSQRFDLSCTVAQALIRCSSGCVIKSNHLRSSCL